jgi:hypothetical protein
MKQTALAMPCHANCSKRKNRAALPRENLASAKPSHVDEKEARASLFYTSSLPVMQTQLIPVSFMRRYLMATCHFAVGSETGV